MIKFIVASQLFVIGVLIWKQHRQIANYPAPLFLIFALIGYLVIDTTINIHPVIHHVLLTGAFTVPFGFWLFSKAIFDDSFKFSIRHWILTLEVIAVYYLIWWGCRNHCQDSSSVLMSMFFVNSSRVISLWFVIMAITEAVRTNHSDLIKQRIQFRSRFIIVSAILIVLTLITEIATKGKSIPWELDLLQKAGIALLVFIFSISQFKLKVGLLNKDTPKPDQLSPTENELLKKMMEVVEKDQIYLREGLTIKELSESLNEHEYKIRKLINGHFGFRNFNEFLNHYRVRDACQMFSDSAFSNHIVLEIAYKLGYRSLAPFNKAFKDITGFTPTEYRKKHTIENTD